jgi:hypothetical protein
MIVYDLSPLTKVDFAPGSVVEEICQNIRTILATPKGSVPLDREFGVDMEGLDMPEPIAQMMFRMNVIDAVERFEPRARVLKVEYQPTTVDAMDGKLLPVVTVEINA